MNGYIRIGGDCSKIYDLETMKSSSGAFVDNLVNKISGELADIGSNLIDKLGSEISSFLPGSLADGSLLDDIANLPQKIIDSVSITRLTDEVGSLFDGTNSDYQLPNFVSSGVKFAKESFDSLVKAGSDAVNSIKGAVSNAGSDAVNSIRDKVSK